MHDLYRLFAAFSFVTPSLVLLRRACMRGHKFIVVIKKYSIAQIFTKSKFVVGFRIGTKGKI